MDGILRPVETRSKAKIALAILLTVALGLSPGSMALGYQKNPDIA
jgi:hypothetical protein